MKNNKNFNIRSMPKSYKRTGESISEIIFNYIFITFILVLIGLIHSDSDGKGFPFDWLQNGEIDVSNLMISFALFFGIVIIADILARISRRGEPEYTSQYKSANVIVNRTSNVLINDMHDFGQSVSTPNQTTRKSGKSDSLPKSSSAKSPKSGRTTKSGNSDNASFDNFPLLAKSNSRNSRTTLNRGTGKNAGNLTGAIAILVIIVAILPIGAILLDSSDDYYSDDYYSDDDAVYDDYDSYDTVRLVADNVFDTYLIEDTDWLKTVGKGNVDAFQDYLDWSPIYSSEVNFIDELVTDDGKTAIAKYTVYENSTDYLIALKLELTNDEYVDINDANVDDVKITGISITNELSDYVENDDLFDLYEAEYDSDLWTEISTKVIDNNASIGDTIINNTPILIWTGNE